MTGATGFLGSHFALKSLMIPGVTLSTIVRGDSLAMAKEKLTASLQTASDSYTNTPGVEEICDQPGLILGDIEHPLCGIAETDLTFLKELQIDEFWHYAASLNYEAKKRSLIESMNIEGMKNALECAKKLRVKRFICISTAYTSGKKSGIIEEILHQDDTEFNNCYEESKFSAEKIVTEFCEAERIPYTILRPSIVIGPSETKKTGGSTTGLYGFIIGICKLKKELKKKGVNEPIRLCGDAGLKINFIPVDQLLDDIMGIVEDNFSKNIIYHLTGNSTIKLKRVIEILTEVIGFNNLYLSQCKDTRLTPIEKHLEEITEFYSGYLKNNKIFNRCLSRKWVITESDLYQFAQNALLEFELNENH